MKAKSVILRTITVAVYVLFLLNFYGERLIFDFQASEKNHFVSDSPAASLGVIPAQTS